jgi:hypothetical protein
MCDIEHQPTRRKLNKSIGMDTEDCVIMSQSVTQGGCSVPDIMHPPLPHPKAVPAELTPEGINRGEAE